MSNYLAIATVTATLRRNLQAAIDVDVPGSTVGTGRPDGTDNGVPNNGVNLFLYQVTPNLSWRNADLPTRDSDGSLERRPQVALDLHYLLSFHGDEAKLEPQRRAYPAGPPCAHARDDPGHARRPTFRLPGRLRPSR